MFPRYITIIPVFRIRGPGGRAPWPVLPLIRGLGFAVKTRYPFELHANFRVFIREKKKLNTAFRGCI